MDCIVLAWYRLVTRNGVILIVLTILADDGEYCSTVTSPSRELVDTESERQSDTGTTSTTTSQQQQNPVYEPIQPSFYTLEEVWFGRNLLVDVPPWHSERGSACCIEMIDPRSNSAVLVGISHANIRAESWAPGLPDRYYDTYFRPGHNSYLSRFYAFQPSIPYKTVAYKRHLNLAQYRYRYCGKL